MSDPKKDTIEAVDYFANHELVVRWPFTIYHRPIERSLVAALQNVRASFTAPLKVLVFGCGYFHERDLYPEDTQFILVDQDLRLKQSMDDFVSRNPGCAAYTCQSALDFEKVVAEHARSIYLITIKEVIEHITEMDLYFPQFKKLLTPGGTLWLSTPNYGDWTLPLVESTFLEVIARCRGFSRKEMHPNRYSQASLLQALESHGFDSINVQKTPYRFALTSTAISPS